MISFNKLGLSGRLGNQMFQYAALRGIAENREFDWIIPPNSIQSTCDYGLFNCFKMSSVSDKNLGFLRDVQSIIWEDTNFNVDLFNNCPDNINLHGYFQSEKYFKHIENIIRKDFEFEDKFKVSYRLTEKLRLYNVGEVTQIKGESNYQAKIGLEYTL